MTRKPFGARLVILIMKSQTARVLFYMSFIVPALNLSADTLDAVRSRLERMSGTSAISGLVTLRVVGRSEDREDEEGRTSARINASSDGLVIRHSAAELSAVRKEARDPDPERNRPATRALQSIDPSEIAEMVDYAPHLLAELEGARILKESDVRLDGGPARLLELELQVRLSAGARKRIRTAESTMKLWISPDAIPLAAEQSSLAKGRFLVITFQGSRAEKRRFATSGNRLVVTRAEKHNEGSGLGQSAGESRWTTLELD